jgi:protein-tyrosine phosphatase
MRIFEKNLTEKVEKNVLVVCTGNLFRSPIAAAFIRQSLVQDQLQDRILVTSAGLEAQPGAKTPESLTASLLSHYKIDLSAHEARPVTPDLFQKADLVLVMEQAQLMRLAQQYPRQSRKLHLISELSGKFYNIADPAPDLQTQLAPVIGELYELTQRGLVTLLRWLELGKPDSLNRQRPG